MKIAVASQNFKSVTGHAGKSRRFIIFDIDTPCGPEKVERLELSVEMSVHEFSGGSHPLDDMNVIIAASAGQGFIARMARRGVQVITCGEREPHKAVRAYLTGVVKPTVPRNYADEARGDREGCRGHAHVAGHCCCGGKT